MVSLWLENQSQKPEAKSRKNIMSEPTAKRTITRNISMIDTKKCGLKFVQNLRKFDGYKDLIQ